MALTSQPNSTTVAVAQDKEDAVAHYLEAEAHCGTFVDFIALRDRDTFALNTNRIWREMVCKWGYDVVDRMGEDRSVVYVAMNILDRFCAMTEETMNEKRYECASLTALFLAIRVAGNCTLQMSDLLEMSREDSLKIQDIKAMGKLMHNLLTWDFQVIPPVDFIRAMMNLLPPAKRTVSLFESASFLSEIAVCDSYLSSFTASQIAYSSLLNAADGVLAHSELEHLCQQMQQRSPLFDPSLDHTATIRSRLTSIYHQIEENYHRERNDSFPTTPRYISDDEEEN